MATLTGQFGSVEIGANAVSAVTSWSLDRTADTVESTAMGDTSRAYETGLKSFTGSFEARLDPADSTGQGAAVEGAEVTFSFYTADSGTNGTTYYTGTGIITSSNISAEMESMISLSVSFQGTGAVTTSTVSA